jgi:uncharacterized protein YjiS (DUF1127 family)
VITHANTLRHASRPPAAASGPGKLRSALRSLIARIARRYRRARARAEIDGLDDGALRDIGIHRSEAASYWAESERLVEQTRMRLLQRMHASP